MTTRDVAVFVGSLRKQSFHRMLAKELISLAPSDLAPEIVEIGQVSFFNQDLEDNPPADWVNLRARVTKADAVLFVTPEYNRSVPAVLKNAVDVGSRPYGKGVWSGKPAAVISGGGAIGGFGANHHLRQSLVFCNMLTMPQPEAYISGINALFDEAGKIKNDSTRDFLKAFMIAFSAWIEKTR
jgi:chromate reductase